VEVEGVADDSRGATEEGMAEESASMGLTMSIEHDLEVDLVAVWSDSHMPHDVTV
jgi:hypothetical protein